MKQKSIQELESDFWPDMKSYPTELVHRCHDLRKIPISDLEVDDIRFLINQNIGISHLLPIAINYLEENIMIEATYYEGDLLKCVLTSSPDFWRKNQKIWARLTHLIQKELNIIKASEEITEEIKETLLKAADSFFHLINNN